MTIEEAIRARYDRFNRLWMNATGHSFEDDDKWCENQTKKEMKVWKRKLAPILLKHGFQDEESYRKSLNWVDGGICGGYYENAIEEIDTILKNKPHYSSLYPYEKYCVDEAARTANWVIENKGIEWWKENLPGKNISEANEMLKHEGFVPDDGHSGNSMGMTIYFTDCLLRNPEVFQYMHGALFGLVGDKGYYDDRSDVPKEECL